MTNLLRLIFLHLIMLLFAATGPVFAEHVHNDNFIRLTREEQTTFSNRCEEQKIGEIKVGEKIIFCIVGKLSQDMLDQYLQSSGIRYIVLNSPGGRTDWAMKIGRKIYEDKVFLIVQNDCHSSCANYLLPASHGLYIQDNTIISMHGSPPRDLFTFMVSAARGRGYSSEEVIRNMDKLFEEFDDHIEKNIIPEVRYFAKIGVQEAYLTRYWSVIRTLKKRKNYNCAPPKGKGLFLVLGPDYLEEFSVPQMRKWQPENKNDYIGLMDRYKKNYSVIVDFDDHPIWLSDKGFVTAEYCIGKSDQ